jgi:hypothetical protein
MSNAELTAFLRQHYACANSLEWLGSRDLAACWAECQRGEWMLWLLERLRCDRATLRRIACAIVRRTPLADGRTVWDLLTDPRRRAAVEVAERYADGLATHDELDAAWSAAWTTSDAAWTASNAAKAAAKAAVWASARAAAWAVAEAAAEAAADAAAEAAADAAWEAAREVADAAQAEIVRSYVPEITSYAAKGHNE